MLPRQEMEGIALRLGINVAGEGPTTVKTIPVDRSEFATGAVDAALSFEALNVPVSDLIPIVKVFEVGGARYTIVSVGHECAEAWELVRPDSYRAKSAKGQPGAYYRRRVRYKGVDYLLLGPFRLAVSQPELGTEPATAPATADPAITTVSSTSSENETVVIADSAGGAEPAPDRFTCECGAPKMRRWDYCQDCTQRRRMAALQGPAPLRPDEFAVYVTPGGVGVVDISPREDEPGAQMLAGREQAPAVVAQEESAASDTPTAPCAGCDAPIPVDRFWCAACEAVKDAGGNPYEVYQAGEALKAAAAAESAASDTPQVRLCVGCDLPVAAGGASVIYCDACMAPAIACHRCGAELHDGEEPGDEGHAVNWRPEDCRRSRLDPTTCDDCRNALVAEQIAALRATNAHWERTTEPRRMVPVDRSPYLEIALAQIRPSPHNPRQVREDDALRELADSIRARGVIQPLLVRRLEGEAVAYELIAGERRLRAAGLAGLANVPAILSTARTELEVRTEQLVENLQRQDLNAVEIARAYQDMADLGMTQTEIGEACGKKQSTVANLLAILDLPGDAQQLIASEQLTASHGRSIARFARWPAVASYMAARVALGLKNHAKDCSVKALDAEKLPFAWGLIDKELAEHVDGYGVKIDKAICEACPFDAYRGGYCLNPPHFGELQAAAIAENEARQAAAVEALQRQRSQTAPVAVLVESGAKGGGTDLLEGPLECGIDAEPEPPAEGPLPADAIPHVADMLPRTYRVLGAGSPCAGCDCPCRATARDRGGELVGICVDPARYDERDREQDARRREAREVALAQIGRAAIAAATGTTDGAERAEAVALAQLGGRYYRGHPQQVLREMGLEHIDVGGFEAHDDARRVALWEALVQIGPDRRRELAVRLIVGAEIANAQWSGAPLASQWLAGQLPAAEAVAAGTCRRCGETNPEYATDWPLDDCCEPCADLLSVRGLIDEDGRDVEARVCDDCGERIGAQLGECPLCYEPAVEGVTEAVA